MRWTEEQLAEFASRRSGQVRTASWKSRRFRETGATEFGTHKAVVDNLRLLAKADVVFWHTPNGERRDLSAAVRLKRMGTLAGIPDIAVLSAGRPHFLELKRERGGAPSVTQRAMHERLRAAGAIVETACGLDEALRVLRSWGALRETKGDTR